MFESLLLSVLERVLGGYVEEIDRSSLKVAVWAGNVTLSNLRLRSEACYALGLPLHVKMGGIRSVNVTIPWSKLGSEPVTIKIDGVYLVAGPLAESNWDAASQREWAWARKSARLMRLSQAAEMSSLQAASGNASDPDEAATARTRAGRDTASLLAKVLNNLQVSVTNIHLRYEDRTQSTAPFAIGVTLAELAAFTTDASGNHRFVVDTPTQHKWVELRELAVYHHCGCEEMMDAGCSLAQLCSWLQGMVATGGSEQALQEAAAAGRQYVIRPMTVGARVVMQPAHDALRAGSPRTQVKVCAVHR